MTKIILHGGFAQHVNAENDAFFTEILKDIPNNGTVLLVEFAHESEKIPKNSAIDQSQFERVLHGRNVVFVVAEESRFPEQLKNADVVYISGGTTVQLMKTMQKFPQFKDSVQGKVVAGESAGANILSTYCYSKSGGGVTPGLEVVPVKLIPHYSGLYKEALESVDSSLELVLLENYQHKVISF